jgi:hypothetical protein
MITEIKRQRASTAQSVEEGRVMSEETKPIYVQCAVCGFWVTQETPSCPNCGVVEPTNTELWEGFGQSRLGDLWKVFGVSTLLIVLGSRLMQALIMKLISRSALRS